MSFFEVVLLFIAIIVSVINMKSLYYNFSRRALRSRNRFGFFARTAEPSRDFGDPGRPGANRIGY
jgi:hypothetical protein